MDIQDSLYIKQMELWVKEQEVITGQLKRAVIYHDEVANNHKAIADLNEHQLLIHEQRIALAKEEFEEWKKDNNIEGETTCK